MRSLSVIGGQAAKLRENLLFSYDLLLFLLLLLCCHWSGWQPIERLATNFVSLTLYTIHSYRCYNTVIGLHTEAGLSPPPPPSIHKHTHTHIQDFRVISILPVTWITHPFVEVGHTFLCLQ